MSHPAVSRRRRHARLAVALVLVASLSSCSAAGALPSPTPTPSPTPEPFFTSDEEAYDAALAVYADYIQISNDVNRAGGTGTERWLDLATTEYANELLQEDAEMRAAGVNANGDVTFRGVSLAWINERRSEFEVDICRGMGGVRMIDRYGNDVTRSDQPEEVPVSVTFKADSSGRVRMAGSQRWQAEGFCQQG